MWSIVRSPDVSTPAFAKTCRRQTCFGVSFAAKLPRITTADACGKTSIAWLMVWPTPEYSG